MREQSSITSGSFEDRRMRELAVGFLDVGGLGSLIIPPLAQQLQT